MAEASRWRILTTRIAGALLGIALLTVGFAGLSLLAGWFETGERLVHRVHDLAWGGIAGLIVAAGLLAQVRAPQRAVAGAQMAALGTVAMITGYLLGTDIPVLAGLAGLVLPVALIAIHPARAEILRPRRPSLPLFVLALVAAVPLILFAVGQAEIARADKTSAHARELHWSGMSAMAFGVILAALVASLRARGWLLPAWSAGLALAVYAVGSLLNPDAPSAAETPWALAALAWSAAFIATAEWIRRFKERELAPRRP